MIVYFAYSKLPFGIFEDDVINFNLTCYNFTYATIPNRVIDSIMKREYFTKLVAHADFDIFNFFPSAGGRLEPSVERDSIIS